MPKTDWPDYDENARLSRQPRLARLRRKRSGLITVEGDTSGEEYTDQGQDYYEERYRERVLRALSQRAAKLGMQVVPVPAPQPA